MTELSGVISSTGLEQEAAVSEACPRELINLTCIASQYACLCQQVSSTVGGHEKLPGDGHEAARWRT